MRTIKLYLSIALVTTAFGIFFSVSAVNAEPANKLDVTVAGVRNSNGVVRCELYSSPKGFREPGKQFRDTVGQIRNGEATCVFNDLPAGSYALAVFHAEQNESQLQIDTFGKPKQGFGFSRNPYSAVAPPSFADTAFEYRGGYQGQLIRITY